MKTLFIISLVVVGQLSDGCKPVKESKEGKLSASFFYGAWADTTSNQPGEGFILDQEGDFFLIFDGNISGGDNYGDSLRLTYKLHIEEKPIVLELISLRTADSTIVKSEKIWTLEPLDSNLMRVQFINKGDSTAKILKREKNEESNAPQQ
jgi:hypothetical protein